MSKNLKLTSTCDDDMFMSGEIVLDYTPGDNLGGVEISFDLQAQTPIYLRKDEILDLIKNLETIVNLIP